MSAALFAAPLAALLVSCAIPALTPASSELRYLVAVLLVVPAMTMAPPLALSASSGRRAWLYSGALILFSGLLLWSAAP